MKKKNLFFVMLILLTPSFKALCIQNPYTIYFAGELFDHKHLTGNTLLANKLEVLYKDRYRCILPQDTECRACTPIETRNHDIVKLMRADLAIFNFDGTELDSGTVVEFMIAKMLDIPSVVLRTDFRNKGDAETVRWNLMAIGYPRTEIVNHNCWLSYPKGIELMHQEIAQEIHRAFKDVIAMPTVFANAQEVIYSYQLMVQLCGSDLSNYLSNDQITHIVQEKIKNGLYTFTM